MTLSDIANNLKIIYAYCQDTYNENDGDELNHRITILNSYLATSAEMLTYAKYNLDKRKGEVAENIEKSTSATQAKNIIEGAVSIENRIFLQCERLNRTITHQLDSIRTQLSYIKTQKENYD